MSWCGSVVVLKARQWFDPKFGNHLDKVVSNPRPCHKMYCWHHHQQGNQLKHAATFVILKATFKRRIKQKQSWMYPQEWGRKMDSKLPWSHRRNIKNNERGPPEKRWVNWWKNWTPLLDFFLLSSSYLLKIHFLFYFHDKIYSIHY